jgi:hypothetical protein
VKMISTYFAWSSDNSTRVEVPEIANGRWTQPPIPSSPNNSGYRQEIREQIDRNEKEREQRESAKRGSKNKKCPPPKLCIITRILTAKGLVFQSRAGRAVEVAAGGTIPKTPLTAQAEGGNERSTGS